MGLIEVGKYRETFVNEARELLSRLSKSLLAWEKAPRDGAALDECFRILHTLKGMTAAMGYEDMAQLAHAMEDTFAQARERALRPSSEQMDDLLRGADVLGDGVENPEGQVDASEMNAVLEKLNVARFPLKSKKSKRQERPPQTSPLPTGALAEVKVTLARKAMFKAARALVVLKEAANFGKIAGTRPEEVRIERGDFESSFTLLVDQLSEPDALRVRLASIPEIDVVEIVSARARPEPPAQTILPRGEEVRVPLSRLDALMTLVGELIVTRESLRRTARDHRLFMLEEPLTRLKRVSSDLEQELMAARMVRAGDALERLPRLMRDQARTLGKEVDFAIEGSDIDLDRAILDRIQEPLLHLLRNALDHGIESPEERRKQGKPPSGRIRLVVQRTRDRVILTASDDGRGIDPSALVQAAVRKGVISEAEAVKLSPSEAMDLLGRPGFSTTKTVTQTSGRGVGMNAVRSMIASMGGRMAIDSKPGEGTTFTLYLPLSLAVIRILLVQVCGHPFALPMNQVVESILLKASQVTSVRGQEVFFRRDEVIPLWRLEKRWSIPSVPRAISDEEGACITVVEVEAGGRKAGLVVDRLLGQEESAIVGLDKLFARIPEFSGVALLGAGTIALVLDAGGLFSHLDEA